MSTTDTREDLAAEGLAFLTDATRRCEGAPFLHRVRAVAPVLRTDASMWLVTRHADALAIHKDGRRWSRRAFTEQNIGVVDPALRRHAAGRRVAPRGRAAGSGTGSSSAVAMRSSAN